MSFLKNSKSLLENECGVTLPFLAFVFVTLIAAVGTATDIARKQLAQSRLTFAVDAAGLAASSTLNTANVATELEKYLEINYPTNYLGTATPTISHTISADNKVIDITATTTMPTTFMRVFGFTTMDLTAQAQITRTSDGLEVVLVLDNSGSMGSSAGGGMTKIQALRASASSLIHILYGTATTIPNLWIGLVPFDSTVNLGSNVKSNWINPSWFPFAGWPPTVVSVIGRHNTTKDTSDALASAFEYDLNSTYNASNCSNYTTYAAYYCSLGPSYASICSSYTSSKNYYCSYTYLPDNIPPVTPLTGNKETILDAIQLLVAYGNTYIDRGAAWGWHLLSPTWRGEWNTEMNSNGLPLDYSTPHMKKAIIIMTDGQNNYPTSDTKLSQICTNMKDNGITVYSITFGSVTGTTLTVMRNCATSINHYFNAPTAATLNTAFNAIADSLSNLRVSK